jgi:adenosylcobinamide kinase / adenosylcobinamide-phosphate guanylyltransferase
MSNSSAFRQSDPLPPDRLPLSASSQVVLVTGPARSGKSEWAERLASQSGKSVVYVATAQSDPQDLEWQNRILQHQQRRPVEWKTLTVPVELAATLHQATASDCLLIDSLGTWLANVLAQSELEWQQTVQELLLSLEQVRGLVILVAEETGWGVVPAYPLGRQFRDRLGYLTRQIGAIANPVYLVTGGHVLNLSQLGTPLPSGKEPGNSV